MVKYNYATISFFGRIIGSDQTTTISHTEGLR